MEELTRGDEVVSLPVGRPRLRFAVSGVSTSGLTYKGLFYGVRQCVSGRMHGCVLAQT